MDTILIKGIPPIIPEGFCTALTQADVNLIVGSAQYIFQSDVANSFYNFGDTVPDASNRGFPWFRTDGGFPVRWYKYFEGFWLARYDPEYNPYLRWEWTGTPDQLKTAFEGEAGTVSNKTGPFWEIDTNFEGRSSMGPGLILNANPAKTLSVEENYGEGSSMATAATMPPHKHPLSTEASITNADGTIKTVTTGAGGPGLMIGLTAPPATPLAVLENTVGGGGTQEGIPVIHPVRGAYKIKRTARIYYRV